MTIAVVLISNPRYQKCLIFIGVAPMRLEQFGKTGSVHPSHYQIMVHPIICQLCFESSCPSPNRCISPWLYLSHLLTSIWAVDQMQTFITVLTFEKTERPWESVMEEVIIVAVDLNNETNINHASDKRFTFCFSFLQNAPLSKYLSQDLFYYILISFRLRSLSTTLGRLIYQLYGLSWKLFDG